MLDLDKLNPQQRQAVRTVEGPLLVLAGAGSGKTRVITCRVGHLIERGIPSRHILAVTFTNRAAREMRDRLETLLGRERTRGLTICTFHSLCVRILREDIAALGYSPSFTIYDEADQVGILRKILADCGRGRRGSPAPRGAPRTVPVSERQPTPADEDRADPRAVLARISRAKNSGGTADRWLQILISRYNAALHNAQALDFDDLLLYAVQLLRKHPRLRAKYQDRYRYILVDEYQDTNHTQFLLLQMLAGNRGNVCVVGDDDQSIYGWRGAQLSNILEFERHFPRAAIIHLEQNYRSTNTILGAANAVIRHNGRRRPKRLWSEHGAGERIALYSFRDEKEEADSVARLIQEARFERQVAYGQQAVLYRTHGQSRPLEEAMRRASIPYRLVGGPSFYDRREIRDLLAYLRLLVNPDDEASLLRILNVPARGLGETTVSVLLGWSHQQKCSAFAALRDPRCLEQLSRRAQESSREFVRLIETFQVGPHGKFGGRVNEFLDRIGYLEELRRTCRDPQEAFHRVSQVQEMAAALMEFERDHPGAGLLDYLDDMALARDEDQDIEEDSREDRVTLITLHACKGLEFTTVYLVGVEDGLLPHERSKAEGMTDEERRLFYVGITRAKRSLTISHALSRTKFGVIQSRLPSPFLQELPAELVERKEGLEPARRACPPMAEAFFARMKNLADA